MKKIAFAAVLFIITLTGFGAKKEISNTGFAFSPANLTIEPGDNVTFVLEAMHNAVEVSKATWDANGNTPLPGGFSVPFGGGELLPAQLPVGTHYYVCTPHAESGMKGIIIVGTPTGIEDKMVQTDISVFPNPATDLITVKSGNELLGSQYFITDQNGNQVLAGKIESATITVNLDQLIRGIYFFQIERQKGHSFKLIKK